MVQWKELSKNARVALCLIYAEKMIPKIKTMIDSHDKSEQYLQGKQQLDDILGLAWHHLKGKEQVDWSEMYYLCSEGLGWTDDVKYNGGGYFDFIWALNGSNDKDAIAISVMMINCFYYAMYIFAKRQNDNIPSDMEWFDCDEGEEEAFVSIDKAVNLFIASDELHKISILKDTLHRRFPFCQINPYGEYIIKENLFL